MTEIFYEKTPKLIALSDQLEKHLDSCPTPAIWNDPCRDCHALGQRIRAEMDKIIERYKKEGRTPMTYEEVIKLYPNQSSIAEVIRVCNPDQHFAWLGMPIAE